MGWHLETSSGVALGSPWLRGSGRVIISGFDGRPSMRSSSRPSLGGYPPSRPPRMRFVMQ